MEYPEPAADWHSVARETFERTMIPWIGGKREGWLRAWARPHPIDPKGQVLVPGRIYRAFMSRPSLQPVDRQQLAAIGYPSLPAAEIEAATATADGPHTGAPSGLRSATVTSPT